MKRLVLILAGLLLMAALGAAGICLAAPPPPALAVARYGVAHTCPANVTCIIGKLIVRDPGSDTPNQALFEDKNGAPMFWINYGGAWSGGEPVCVVGLHLQRLVCMGIGYGGSPTVTFYGPGGAVTWTRKDVRFVHRLERRFR